MLTEIQTGKLRPVMFYEGVFLSDTLRLWTGLGTVSWNGQSWLGVGQLLGLTAIEEASDNTSTGFTVSLQASSGLINRALQECRHNKVGKIWLGALDAAGAIIADPILSRSGFLDYPKISDSGETCTIAVMYEDENADLRRPRERRYTHEDQKIDYPTDLGFEYVAALQEGAIPSSVVATPTAPVNTPGSNDPIGPGHNDE